ncbi:MAG: DNA-processing protein DprA [Acidobacteria bacterium]|nr:DNA-processing protein DprA [Acidobacteriota bacterium]MDA1234542.1 DNA-processing protein DprA [Acidobacteriota bacterium]
MAAPAATQETQLNWLALHLTPGLGARNALRLIQIFGHPEGIFHASLIDLKTAMPRLRGAVIEAIHSGLSYEGAADELRKAEAIGVAVIPYQDPRYPQLLKEIHDPPVLLYAKGDLGLLAGPSVAVVGTRRPTPYGRAVAEKIVRDLVEAGLVHVSGMARGIDAAAHKGALAGGGASIAVLGTGVDVPYPRENRKLYDELVERGLVVSEFPLGSVPFPQNFPIRNRIISGMSLAVVVVEGAQYSGSLITARLAMEQDREVMAVPGPIVSQQSWGPNLLIKDGAKLIQEALDVIEELPQTVRQELVYRERSSTQQGPALAQTSLFGEQVSPTGKKILALLRIDEALHIDEIIRTVRGESPADVLAALSELELFGSVKQLPGKSFVLAWRD